MTVKNNGLRETEGLREIGVNNEIHTCNNDCQRPACVAVREAVLAEREACAKLCDEQADEHAQLQEFYELAAVETLAEAIRARGEN